MPQPYESPDSAVCTPPMEDPDVPAPARVINALQNIIAQRDLKIIALEYRIERLAAEAIKNAGS